MALINCPECQKEVSNNAYTCPNCGFPISGEKNEENIDGAPQVEKIENEQSTLVIDKGKVIGTCIVILVILTLVISFAVRLSGDDKKAFDLLVKAADDFKDPSSVRLVSGSFDKAGTLCCAISATNGFNARVTSYYNIYSDGTSIKIKYSDSEYDTTKSLNIKKINNKLKNKLASFD